MDTVSETDLGGITINVCQWRAWPQVLPSWVKLSSQCKASFFLSNHWVTTWLDVFAEQLQPEILLFSKENNFVGACLLVRSMVRRGFLPFKCVYVNCAGESKADDTCVEYNRLVCLPGNEREVASSLQQYLQRDSWDELMLYGFEPQEENQTLSQGAYREKVTEKPCRYVDFAALRREGVTYEKILSRKARKQIRRCIRQYQQTAGALSLERAGCVSEALEFLEELVRLHQKAWRARGKTGAFSSARFYSFHRQLVERAFPEGQIELVRVLAGDQPIGVLYSFFYNGRIYFYQCGFAYQEKALSPGLVTHFLAVQYYLARPDVLEYDFLAGDSLYKRLAQSQRTLEWRVVQRPTLGVKTIEALRSLKSYIQKTPEEGA